MSLHTIEFHIFGERNHRQYIIVIALLKHIWKYYKIGLEKKCVCVGGVGAGGQGWSVLSIPSSGTSTVHRYIHTYLMFSS